MDHRGVHLYGSRDKDHEEWNQCKSKSLQSHDSDEQVHLADDALPAGCEYLCICGHLVLDLFQGGRQLVHLPELG